MTNPIFDKLFKSVISMKEFSDQIRTAVALIPNVKLLEETLATDSRYATYIISFEVPNKGYWIAFTNQDYALASRAHVLLYQLNTRITFSTIKQKALLQKNDFPSTLFETCETSPHLIKVYPNHITSFELPYFINNTDNV